VICWSVLSRWNDEKENAHFFPRLKMQENKINFVIIKKNSTFAPEKYGTLPATYFPSSQQDRGQYFSRLRVMGIKI